MKTKSWIAVMLSSLSRTQQIFLSLFIGVTGALAYSVIHSNQADAQVCFNSGAARDSALPITGTFPRGALAREAAAGCAQQSSSTTWTLISSYYYLNSSSQSALHTPRARFNTFYNGPSAPPSRQTILIAWHGRCNFSGPTEVYLVNSGGGRTRLTSTAGDTNLFGSDASVKLRAYQYNANWVNGGARYGADIWKDSNHIMIEATATFPGSTISCKARIANTSGNFVSFFEDRDSQQAYAEGSQRHNYFNWNRAGGKRILGPNGGGDGAYALWSDNPSRGYLEYAIPFAASCDITTARTTRLRIYDMDHRFNSVRGVGVPAGGPTQARRPYMSLFNERTRSRVPLTGNGFTNATTVEVNIGNDEYAEYTFTIQPGDRYTWVFWDVLMRNGLQLWMPFSEVHATYGCSTWDHEPETFGSPAHNSTVYPGQSVYVLPRIRNVLAGAGPNRWTMEIQPLGRTASRTTRVNSTITSGGTTLGTHGAQWRGTFSIAGNSQWNPSRYVQYRINTNAVAGDRLCFRVRVAQDSPTNAGWDYDRAPSDPPVCYTVARNEYNYVPGTVRTYSTYSEYYAGETFDARALVTNTSTNPGIAYQQRLYMTSARGISGSYYAENQPALGGRRSDAADTRFRRQFRVPRAASHGEDVFCTNWISRTRGLAPPSPHVSIVGASTNPSSFGSRRCFEVYNLRFNIETPNTGGSTASWSESAFRPGDPFSVDIRVCNTDNFRADGYSRASHGVAPNVTATITGSTNVSGGGTQNTNFPSILAGRCSIATYNGTVSTSADLGQQVCVDISINRDRGFSTGDANFLIGGPLTSTFCADVAEQAYFEVQNGSVWSGGNFDNPANGGSPQGYGTDWCAPAGRGVIETARLGNVGGWASYVAGAVGVISLFGSEHINTGQVNDTGLSFANTGSPGNFNAGRCMTDLYTYMSQDTTRPNIRNLPGTSGWPSANGQWVVGGLSYSVGNGALPGGERTIGAGERYTIIVDGNVTISDNITFDSGYNAADTSQIPSFILIVNGNLDITDNVTNLDGMYFATGQIDTCSNGPAQLHNGVCNNRLTVTGAFMANDIEFRRTHGGVSGGNPFGGNDEAELFIHSPEMYLAEHFMVPVDIPNLQIDQVLDLPPVIN